MLMGCALTVSAVSAIVLCLCLGAFESLVWLWLLPVGFVVSFVVFVLLAIGFLWILGLPVDMDKPREQDSKFYRAIANLYVDGALALLWMRVHTEGLEKLPKDRRFLMVCNHIHILDPVTLLSLFKKSQLAFISKRENYDLFAIGKIMHMFLCQSLNRENDREALKTILRCVQLLKDDKASVAVFPEGYTSQDGKLHGFRHGVFKIAQRANVPIVVCTIQSTNRVFRNILRLRPTDIALHLLDVIEPEELKGVTTVQIGEQVHAIMAADLGPENVAAE